ncbi:POK10 protein, partial [Pterocles burchelli]|nr:POK10 protein [Pterocles burchelli]
SLVEANARADALVLGMAMGPTPNIKQQAIVSHKFFHQGYRALKQQFHLSNAKAHAIAAACPDSQGQCVLHYYGTNPRGLRALQIWQTDVTHIVEFGRLKFVHPTTEAECMGNSGKYNAA